MNLRIPGPTPCPPEVLKAVGRQMINHRGPEFAAMLARVDDRVKQVYQTKNDVALLTSGGTGAMEALVVNTLSPGDKVLSSRLAPSATASRSPRPTAPTSNAWTSSGASADAAPIDRPWTPPKIKAVLVTHNETSTGVTNPLERIASRCASTARS